MVSLQKFIDRAPQLVKKLFGFLYDNVQQVHSKLLEWADSLGIVSPDAIYDEAWFQEMANNDELAADADQIVDSLYEEVEPESVLDIGCGVGLYLEAFDRRGVSIAGIDGATSAIDHAVVDDSQLKRHDLREPYVPTQEYNLVICFEVAEHIQRKHADTLVDSIVRSGPVVAFTAATPGQGGTHHVNEQPRGYWKQKFADRGMVYDGDAVSRIRDRIAVSEAEWIPANLFIFRDEEIDKGH